MNMPRAFMSHSHEDNDFAVRLARDLRTALGDEDAVWYDASDLKGGDDWWRKIQHEIQARPVFIVVLSPVAMASDWVNDEVNIAWRLKNSASGKHIIPVMCSACEPRQDLSGLQIVSFVPPHVYAVQFSKVLDAFRRATSPHAEVLPHVAGGVPSTSARTDQMEKAHEVIRRECQRNLDALKAIWRRVEYDPAPEGASEEVAFEKRLRLSRCSTQTWERGSVAIAGILDALSLDELDGLQVLHTRLTRFDALQRELQAKFAPPDVHALVAAYENWNRSPKGSAQIYKPELSGKLTHFNIATRTLFTEWEGLCNEALQADNPISNVDVPRGSGQPPSTPRAFSPAFASEDAQRAFYESVEKQVQEMGPPIFRKDMKF